jgi:hypothetical protein
VKFQRREAELDRPRHIFHALGVVDGARLRTLERQGDDVVSAPVPVDEDGERDLRDA